SLDFDVEHLALPHARHAGNAERLERAFDRLALGIEDAGFERDGDTRFHAIPIFFLIGTPPPSIWPESPAAQALAAHAAAAAATCQKRAKLKRNPPQCTGATACAAGLSGQVGTGWPPGKRAHSKKLERVRTQNRFPLLLNAL